MPARTAARQSGAADAYDVVHAPVLREFPELVAELGGSAPEIVRRAGLPGDCAGPSGDAVTYRGFAALMEAASTALACPDFGMRLAARQNGSGVFGPLGQVMRNCDNFGEALEYVAGHAYAHSLAARVWLRRLPGASHVFAGHDILLGGATRRVQAIEQILLTGHLSAMVLTGGQARVRVVHFRHEPVSSARTYRRYFGCEVRFGEPADGVTFANADLASPIVARDAQAFSDVTTLIDTRFTRRQPPLHAQVRATMLRLLAAGSCTNEQVASALCLHLRTLHRRLREEGTSFQALKDEVRRDLLLYYLEQTDFALTRISERLGFAEQSVMSRCCRRWFGLPPSALRRRAAA